MSANPALLTNTYCPAEEGAGPSRYPNIPAIRPSASFNLSWDVA